MNFNGSVLNRKQTSKNEHFCSTTCNTENLKHLFCQCNLTKNVIQEVQNAFQQINNSNLIIENKTETYDVCTYNETRGE